jgi:hypothetical protein
VLSTLKELLQLNHLHEEWQERRNKMLVEKIDTAAFLTWFLENYPESVGIMRKNPEQQMSFK